MAVDPRVETLALLRSIDASLKALVARDSGGAPAANDSVCNGPHGDPIVKAKDPRDWSGEPQHGKHFSECPAEYLDLLADRYDYFASKAERAKADASDDDELQKAEKDMKYARLDGARARAWAARKRNGWTAPTPQGGFSDGGF